MPRVFRTKLLLPVLDDCLDRPRLTGLPRTRMLVAQAPAGAGKSTFLAQWATATGLPRLFYQLDEQDRDGAVFAAHVCSGFRACWPDWSPPPEVESDPSALAVEIVNEAAGRPEAVLVLDRLEAAFGCNYLADFLAVLVRYAPPSLTLAVGTRAPLPADLSGRPLRVVSAADLAFTHAEATAWLGQGDWGVCHAATQGFPLALQLWRQHGAHWQTHLVSRMAAGLPGHVLAEVGAALTGEWLSGRIDLTAFAYRVAEAQVGLEQLTGELRSLRDLMLLGEFPQAAERLGPLWESARCSGDRPLTGLVALLRGELCYCRGEYAQALDWYGRAFEADPLLKTTGCHSMVTILKDLGQLEEADEAGRGLIAGCSSRGDLKALSYAHCQYAAVCTELGRFEEAERNFREAEQLGIKLSGEPFYGILAMAQRAVSYLQQEAMAEYRRVAEEAFAMARRRSPWLAAICGYILAPALFAWKEYEEGARLLAQSQAFLTRIDAKWQLHGVCLILSLLEAGRGNTAAARELFDRSLALAAREGYVQYLKSRVDVSAVTSALSRGVEGAFCQELMVRMGERAVPALVELTGCPDPAARRAALYPLARIGGAEAGAAIRGLMYDPDELVRDAAILAGRAINPAEATVEQEAVSAAAVGEAPALRLQLLGPVQVAVGGEVVQGWRTVKARDLIAYLALAGDRPATRDQLMEALWPDTDLESAHALLHTTIYYLRRALRPVGEGLITFAGGAYRLDRERVSTDLDRFWKLTAAGGETAWREAVDLYRGDLLEGIDYQWAEAPRVRVRTACLDALRNLSAHLRATGRPAEAVESLQRLITLDPLAEEGHLGLMECYAALGNRNAALHQYRTLVHMLDEELGLEPGPEAQALYRRLIG
ncbi:MAG TPA: BTAD domain-containing putative transcriptional regulator [Symbiobacteriaceae bacterium]|nr:BTAD domain-containing putative transcriptional regulator [Symbiobacteriaceae bacterium]